MSAPIHASAASHTPEERRSGTVFTVILLLALLAVAFPEMAPQALQGILWTGAGMLMILLPPVIRLPRVWVLLATGFLLFSLVGFLPREWFHVSSWRNDLEALGLDTGARAFVQPNLAAEVMAGFAATALTCLFLLGHRIDSRCHHRLVMGFALGVGAWTAVALLVQKPGETFGFFPNRNHTATLLVMGTFAGLGSLAQAIRWKAVWKILLSAIPIIVCLYALHTVSESRAGVILVPVGFVIWILLIGFRHLKGNAGKALVLILIAVGGSFLIVESKAKKRLTTTIEQLSPAESASATTPENPFAAGAVTRSESSPDGRITIFQDTLKMCRHEPWTGVGPGQFAQVFPQYREKTDASNNSICLHPESDWLFMLAENGWPATLCLALGVIVVFSTSVKQARRGRARLLRMGSLVAALLLCLHGIFDVPGHRVGLAWAAALLLASSLRFPEINDSESISGPSRFSGFCWRALGLLFTLTGIGLIFAQCMGKFILPSVQAKQFMLEAKALYDKDQAAYDKATAEGRYYDPSPAEDPLETALLRAKQAINVTPLDPYPHYIRGHLALHYDDKTAIANREFPIHRRLDPTRVNLTVEQAQAWVKQDPQQAIALWKEALHRATIEEKRLPNSHWGVANTYQRALNDAGKNETLISATLELADANPTLIAIWVRSAPASLLDQEMPRLLTTPTAPDAHKSLFQIWEKRGTKDAATNFAKAHPELELSPP